MQNKINKFRKDLSQLEASKDKDISNFRHWDRLERKYSIRVKRLNVVIETVLGKLWSQSTDHKKDAKWLQDLRSDVNDKKQEKMDINTGSWILVGCQIGSHQVHT